MITPYNNPSFLLSSVTRMVSTCRMSAAQGSNSDSFFQADNNEEDNLMLMQQREEWKEFQELFLEFETMNDVENDDEEDDAKASLEELLQLLDVDDDDEEDDDGLIINDLNESHENIFTSSTSSTRRTPQQLHVLEQALLQGVVPVSAGVGDDQLPGDYGFDPLHLSTRDTMGRIQRFLWGSTSTSTRTRPAALILRDYRESEIRHGRLAMLATVLWPLQELLDRLVFIDDGLYGRPLWQTSVTLPYFPLLMTGIMLLLGYLDIYSQAIKDLQAGEAFLPADCFWDPLSVLDGGSDRMKRNMQERELLVRAFKTRRHGSLSLTNALIHSLTLFCICIALNHIIIRMAASPCLDLLSMSGKSSSHKHP